MVTNINYNGGKEVSYQYNAVGDLVRMEDWIGVNTFEADLLNRIAKVTDHKGKVVTYGYSGSADGHRSADLRRRAQRLQRRGSGFLLGQGVRSRALCRWYPPGHLGYYPLPQGHHHRGAGHPVHPAGLPIIQNLMQNGLPTRRGKISYVHPAFTFITD